jgi:hypothetical protein
MYGGKRPDPVDFRRILSYEFRPVPTRKHGQLAEIHRKKIRTISGRNTVTFLQDSVAGIFDLSIQY